MRSFSALDHVRRRPSSPAGNTSNCEITLAHDIRHALRHQSNSPQTALPARLPAVIAAIGEIERFATPQKLASYLDAKKITLGKLRDRAAIKTIQYVYDFGNEWDHSIRIDRVNGAAQGVTYPRLLKATGICPSEDVGGVWGYDEFLEALADPVHEQLEDMVHWSGGDFDRQVAEVQIRVAVLNRLMALGIPLTVAAG